MAAYKDDDDGRFPRLGNFKSCMRDSSERISGTIEVSGVRLVSYLCRKPGLTHYAFIKICIVDSEELLWEYNQEKGRGFTGSSYLVYAGLDVVIALVNRNWRVVGIIKVADLLGAKENTTNELVSHCPRLMKLAAGNLGLKVVEQSESENLNVTGQSAVA